MTPTITIPAAHLVTAESFGGNCPVQGFGRIQHTEADPVRAWYFRARGAHWSLTVGDEDEPGSHYVNDDGADLCVFADYGEPGGYDAGWMPADEAIGRIVAALTLYLSGARGEVEVLP